MKQELTRFEALKLAVDRIGTQQKCAELLGVTQPSVWRWLNQLRQLPAEYVLRVEAATGISRHVLRPDIYPREINLAPTPSAIGEPYVECGPILSARTLSQHGNNSRTLAGRGAA